LQEKIEAFGRKEDEMKGTMKRWVIWYMVIVMFIFGITPRLYAGFSPSEVIYQSPAERSADLEKIRKFIEIKMIRERLEAFGFTQSEIQTRLSQLRDEQVHQLALKLDELNVGGDGAEAVIVVLLVAVLVVLVIYLMGYRVIFKRG
jgi:hypothetical protein